MQASFDSLASAFFGAVLTALCSSTTTLEEPPPIVNSFPNNGTTVVNEVVAVDRLGLRSNSGKSR